MQSAVSRGSFSEKQRGNTRMESKFWRKRDRRFERKGIIYEVFRRFLDEQVGLGRKLCNSDL